MSGDMMTEPADSPIYGIPSAIRSASSASAPVRRSSCSRKNELPPPTYMQSASERVLRTSGAAAVETSSSVTRNPS